MSTVRPPADPEGHPRVKAVFDDIRATRKTDFVNKLTTERREWGVSRLQPFTLSVFQAALAAQKAGGETEIVLEEHPPEIPGIRVFQASAPPSKPTPPPDPTKPPPRPAPAAGGTTLILD